MNNSQDQQHLELLAIFHYIVGGLMLLFSCLALIYIALGVAMLLGMMDDPNPAPKAVGVIFTIVGGIFLLTGWTLGTLTIIAGKCLSRRRKRTFCMVMAGISCMFMPFGTVLGVFTLVVLSKSSVVALFEAAAPPPMAQ